MKRVLPLTAALAVVAQGVDAQRRFDQDKMKANYAEMQKHDWFTGGGWVTDFAAAKAKAKETGKPIFAYFTRTYSPWPPCIALEKRVFSDKAFQAWGKDNAILFAAVMTKIEGRKDDSLLSTYGFRGFPSMAILDASGEAITKSVKRDLPSMKTAVNAAGNYVKMKAKVDAGEDYDKKAWFLAQMGLGMLSADEAKGCAAELGLKGDEAKEVDGAILALELNGLMRRRGGNPSDKIYEWFKAGRRLNKGASERAFFDGALNQAAIKNNDAAAFKYSVDNAKKTITQNAAAWKSRLPRFERDLERFKDDARILPQVENAIRRAKNIMKQSETQLAKIEAFAKKIAEKGTGN